MLCITCTSAAYAQTANHKLAVGTGIFISYEGHILTAYHVIENCAGDIGVFDRNRGLRVTHLSSDKTHDLALLKVATDADIPSIAYFVDPQTPVHEGDPVVVAGYPRSMLTGQDFPEFSTNSGSIISTDRFIDKNGEKPLLFSNITEQGFSGGPVLDAAGNIIGITLAGTCISQTCQAGLDAALAAKEQGKIPTEESEKNIKRFIDANMAANLDIIRRFLNVNNVPYAESAQSENPSEDRIAALSQTIVNVRCHTRSSP
jgi:S1-C subfamily serine protease